MQIYTLTNARNIWFKNNESPYGDLNYRLEACKSLVDSFKTSKLSYDFD